MSNILNTKTKKTLKNLGKSGEILLLSFLILAVSDIFSNDSNALAQSGDRFNPIKIGILPDTQGYEASVAIHPMEAVLNKLQDEEVNIVIPVGDLTNQGTTYEFDQWTQVAEKYREAGIEFLPLMGNHETSYAYSVEWIENMRDYIPKDAVHMSGAQYNNYYVIRENVLIILLRHGNLPIAFQWVKDIINDHKEKFDHTIIASHDGLIGSKYGQAKGLISSKGNSLLREHWKEIRSFFSRHDVIWVQGHEHMYQRSVISAPIDVDPKSWKLSDRNYRLPQYTQIVSGNASYKGYEFRYGEREHVQNIIQQKVNALQYDSEEYDANASTDVNASVFKFDNSRVEYVSYFSTHTIKGNDEGRKELADTDWTLLDKFSRTTDRCERLIYANSIPETTRSALYFDPFYRTNYCFAPDGSKAKIIDGINNTFNRVESTTETLSFRPGVSRAENQMDLARLAYKYLFRTNQPWSPNLNSEQRLIPSDDKRKIEVPETTIDLKEHLTLSWLPATPETLSDILIVSGTQVQSGTYQNAYGMEKDIEKDDGLEGSQPDGSAKEPHDLLPDSATKSWDITSAVGDSYVLQFKSKDFKPNRAKLAYLEDGNWIPFTSKDCVLKESYSSELIDNLSANQVNAQCLEKPIVGFEGSSNSSWWVVLNSDVEVALIERRN